jgi:hypothetical protein
MNVRGILASHGGHLAAVPVVWYYPAAWDNDALLDRVPAPSQGNTMTVRAYAESWIKSYDGMSPNSVGIHGSIDTPQLVPDTNSSQSIWQATVDALTHPWDATSLISTPLDAIKAFLSLLTSAETWIRVAQILGGFAMVGMGIWTLTHDQPISAVGNTVKGAASVAALA